jgi:hypothetical protein
MPLKTIIVCQASFSEIVKKKIPISKKAANTRWATKTINKNLREYEKQEGVAKLSLIHINGIHKKI